MKGYKIIDFDVHPDDRGNLVALSANKEIPFEIKRIYYTWDMPKEAIRGGHAHRVLDEVMVCLHGSCDFVLDDGKTRETVWLNRPDVGLYIGKNMWREMRHFSYGCKLMILASKYYDEKEWFYSCGSFDYIGYHRCSCDFNTSCFDVKHSGTTSNYRF